MAPRIPAAKLPGAVKNSPRPQDEQDDTLGPSLTQGQDEVSADPPLLPPAGPVHPVRMKEYTSETNALIDPPSDDDDSVLMDFPRMVNLIHAGIMHKFPKGVNKVPKELASHNYLKAHGVVKLEPKGQTQE
jgi:hypothetical protein